MSENIEKTLKVIAGINIALAIFFLFESFGINPKIEYNYDISGLGDGSNYGLGTAAIMQIFGMIGLVFIIISGLFIFQGKTDQAILLHIIGAATLFLGLAIFLNGFINSAVEALNISEDGNNSFEYEIIFKLQTNLITIEIILAFILNLMTVPLVMLNRNMPKTQKQQKLICPQCGTKQKDKSAEFCSSCGQKI